MRLLGTILAACAVAAVIPYKIKVDEQDGSVNAKALIYDLKYYSDGNGNKKVNISLFGDIKKAANTIFNKKDENAGDCCECECNADGESECECESGAAESCECVPDKEGAEEAAE